MFCTGCGAQIKEGAKFCTKCGKAVGDKPKINGSFREVTSIQETNTSFQEVKSNKGEIVDEPVMVEKTVNEPAKVNDSIDEPIKVSEPVKAYEPVIIQDMNDADDEVIIEEEIPAEAKKIKKEKKPSKPQKAPKSKDKKIKREKSKSDSKSKKIGAKDILIAIMALIVVGLIVAIVLILFKDKDQKIYDSNASEVIEQEQNSDDDEDIIEIDDDDDEASEDETQNVKPDVIEFTEPEEVVEEEVFPEWDINTTAEITYIEDMVSGYKNCLSSYKYKETNAAGYYSVDGTDSGVVVIRISAGHGSKELRDINSERTYFGSGIFYVEEYDYNTGSTNVYYFSDTRLFACVVDGVWHYYGSDDWAEFNDKGVLLTEERAMAKSHFND